MSSSSLAADLELLRSGRMASESHQSMYVSMYQLALRSGDLLLAKVEATAPHPFRLFRRNTVKSQKHRSKLKKLKFKKGRAQSQLDSTETEADLDQEQQQEAVGFGVDVAVRAFHNVVKKLNVFVVTFAKTDKVVFHLASMRRMFLDLQAIGVKLEWVLKAAGLKQEQVADPKWKDGEWSWQKQLQADRDKEETDLSSKAAKNALPFARNMMPHEPMEALTLLKFEIDFFKADNSTKHVNSMKKVFFSVVRSSNGRVARIPEWYIPPYALSYARDKKMVGSVGTSYHGVWVDRKPVDVKSEDGDMKVVTHNVLVKRIAIHADAIDTFRKEVEIWFNLDHVNILKLDGASHCSHPAILVTEEACNGSLEVYLHEQGQKGRGNQRKQADLLVHEWPYRNQRHAFWSLFLEAAHGLQFLHENKIVHGNLKSNNILITADRRVKLTDFGLGMLMLQNQMVQDEEVEKSRQAEYVKKKKQGLSVKKPPVQNVKKFKDMGWRAPNCRAKKQFGRPTFQDDIYSFGLCLLDVLVSKLSSNVREQSSSSSKNVGDEGFEPWTESVTGKVTNDDDRRLIIDMCKEKPEDRLSLAKVISRMEKLRDAAAQEPADSSECCML